MATALHLPESRRATGGKAPAQPPPSGDYLPPFGRIKSSRRSGDVVLDRAEYEIDWYNRHANNSRIAYCSIKLAQVLLAAFVPVAAGFSAPKLVTGSLGGMIVVLEGVQQLFRFHDNWVRYRLACEGMTREKYLYAAGAGDYARNPHPRRLLAERIESLATREAQQWVNMQKSDSDGSPASEADNAASDQQVTTQTVAQHTVSKQVISEQVTSAQVTSEQVTSKPTPPPAAPQQAVMPQQVVLPADSAKQ